MVEKTYYQILELNSSACEDEIKKSYRRLALQWHPDKNQNNLTEAERRFKEISEAYEVLSDKEKRKTYDEFDRRGPRRQFPPESNNNFSHSFFNFSPFQFSDLHFRNPFDIYEDFFGTRNAFNERNLPNIFNQQNYTNDRINTSSNSSNPSSIIHSYTKSTKVTNNYGVKTTITNIVENGIETVIVDEDGKTKSKKVNGVETVKKETLLIDLTKDESPMVISDESCHSDEIGKLKPKSKRTIKSPRSEPYHIRDHSPLYRDHTKGTHRPHMKD